MTRIAEIDTGTIAKGQRREGAKTRLGEDLQVPSPIGHALGAMALGWLIAPRLRRGPAMAGLTYAAIGVAPDLDLLVGAHSTYTHSVGAVGIVFFVAWAVSRRPQVAAAIAAAWASHLLLDWLGSDTSPPIGIMALWPFSREHYQSSFYLFDAISRRYWLPEQFVWSNLKAALREVLILGPVAGISYWMTYVNHRHTKNRENAQSS